MMTDLGKERGKLNSSKFERSENVREMVLQMPKSLEEGKEMCQVLRQRLPCVSGEAGVSFAAWGG